eukprot:11206538-Lingulodinium_polyedra.AAC.1
MPRNTMPTTMRAMLCNATPRRCMRTTPCMLRCERHARSIRTNARRHFSIIHVARECGDARVAREHTQCAHFSVARA